MSERPTLNVIIFGGPGVGKSSIVNMILGNHKAEINTGATRRTSESVCYPAEIKGEAFNLHDTVSLDEGKSSTAGSRTKATNLGQLVKQLSNTGGVSLLVFVMKCGRLDKTIQKNYSLLRKHARPPVPIVIVVTGCENIEPMDNWWTDNEDLFSKARMNFDGHACICAERGRKSKGGKNVNDEQFEKSKEIVRGLIHSSCLRTKPAVRRGGIMGILAAVFGSLLGGKNKQESKEKGSKKSKEKGSKQSKEKDSKQSKEKDSKQPKEKGSKQSKEKDSKQSKEKGSTKGGRVTARKVK